MTGFLDDPAGGVVQPAGTQVLSFKAGSAARPKYTNHRP
jgi:hypothetical protein